MEKEIPELEFAAATSKNEGWLDNPLTANLACRRMMDGGEPM